MCPAVSGPSEDDSARPGTYYGRTQVLMLAAAALLLSIKSDARFPLPESLPEPVFQLILIPYTLAFIGALALFAVPDLWPPLARRLAFLEKISILRLSVAISALFEAMALALLFVENARFSTLGYDLNVGLTVVLFMAIFAALAGMLLYRGLKPVHVLAFALAAYAGTYLLSIVSFPLVPGRSDMFILIMEAARNFLAGLPPYSTYFIPPNALPLTYLPALWLSYLPAAFFGFDPRLINLACVAASAVIIYAAAGDREKASALLAVFLLTPYLQYRHELYLGVIWLFLAVLFYGIVKKRPILATLSMALLASAYQLAWIFIPFFLVYVLYTYGKRYLAVTAAVIAVACAVLIVPFAVWSPSSFFSGIFGHWTGQRFVSTANFSYVISLIIGWDRLIFIQAAALGALFLVSIRLLRAPRVLFIFLAAALALFVLLSAFIDAYFYLIVLLLLVMAALMPARHL